jgi:hypothetical protein
MTGTVQSENVCGVACADGGEGLGSSNFPVWSRIRARNRQNVPTGAIASWIAVAVTPLLADRASNTEVAKKYQASLKAASQYVCRRTPKAGAKFGPAITDIISLLSGLLRDLTGFNANLHFGMRLSIQLSKRREFVTLCVPIF